MTRSCWDLNQRWDFYDSVGCISRRSQKVRKPQILRRGECKEWDHRHPIPTEFHLFYFLWFSVEMMKSEYTLAQLVLKKKKKGSLYDLFSLILEENWVELFIFERLQSLLCFVLNFQGNSKLMFVHLAKIYIWENQKSDVAFMQQDLLFPSP